MKSSVNESPESWENPDARGARAYEESRKAAARLVEEPDQLERFLDKLEEKLKKVPKLGSFLANIPVLVSMVRAFLSREYTAAPVGTIIGIVTALVYFLSPVDIIPDTIPGLGLVDDGLVVAVTMAFVGADVDAYKEWRKTHPRTTKIDAQVW